MVAIPKIRLEPVLEKITHADEARDLLKGLKPLLGNQPQRALLHATCLITSLFSHLGSDESNSKRICTNFEVAARMNNLIQGLLS